MEERGSPIKQGCVHKRVRIVVARRTLLSNGSDWLNRFWESIRAQFMCKYGFNVKGRRCTERNGNSASNVEILQKSCGGK